MEQQWTRVILWFQSMKCTSFPRLVQLDHWLDPSSLSRGSHTDFHSGSISAPPSPHTTHTSNVLTGLRANLILSGLHFIFSNFVSSRPGLVTVRFLAVYFELFLYSRYWSSAGIHLGRWFPLCTLSRHFSSDVLCLCCAEGFQFHDVHLLIIAFNVCTVLFFWFLSLSLAYRKTTDNCTLIFIPTLLNLFLSS